MIKLNFLGADRPLTKRFLANGEKTSYQGAYNFTSYHEQVNTIQDFHDALVKHAKAGNCLLKGTLTRTLNNEPRAGTTRTNDPTQYVCLDFDRYVTSDLDASLKKMGIGDVSYVIQYSSSHGLPETMGTVSAHVFMLLDEEIAPPVLKLWLKTLNFDYIRDGMRLNKDAVTINYPLDVTTCQNDKLLFIAPPIFDKPLKDPLHQRIRLVKKKKATLEVSRINQRAPNVVKKQEREILNEMRELKGLPPRRAGTKWIKTYEIESRPDVCYVSETRDCGTFIRLNINGGDSWAYWHPVDDFEIIHSFKGDTSFLTKEFVPEYYKECMELQQEQNTQATDDGDIVLAFCDKRSAEYYRGIWNPAQQHLELYRARNETQLNDWMLDHGKYKLDHIPSWEVIYDPRADWIVDEEQRMINTFQRSPYMDLNPDKTVTPGHFPNIYRMIRHFLGEHTTTELSDHFLNWFAVIFQRKAKPITAWVNHGTQGTGKGFFMSKVVTPLFGKSNVSEVGINNIEDQFNGWQEGKLFINVNEIDADDFTSKGRVEARFKMLITDNTMPVRRMRQTMSQEPNYGSYLFSSNKPKPVIIAMDDRRYNVGNRQMTKLVPPKEEEVANELEAFAQWLLAHKADVALANSILHTDARASIQRLGVNSIQETVNSMIEGDFDTFWMNMVDDEYLARGAAYNETERSYNSLIKSIGKKILEDGVRQTLSRDEMGLILSRCVGNISTEPNKLTSLLRQNGIETKQIRHNGRKTYGIHVVWKLSDDIRAEVIEQTGSKPKLRRAK